MVRKYETGAAAPPSSVLPDLARVVGAAIDDLFVHNQSPARDGGGDEPRSIDAPASAKKKRKPKPKSPDTFGSRLADARRVRGLSQRQLAEAVEISSRMIAYYEARSGNPPLTLLAKFAEVLQVSVDDLVATKGSPSTTRSASLRLLRRVQALEALPPRQQRYLLGVIDAVVQGGATRERKG
jgi:transcriptional regulator with XRE-family HTH domain